LIPAADKPDNEESAMTLPDYAMRQPSFPEMYERLLVEPLFKPWAEILIDRASLKSGDRLLDVACGTGIVSRVAHSRLAGTGRVVGVDLSPQMLAVARSVAPDIDWREGSASSLPVDEKEKFDVLICQQGLQFFPDKPVAAREMHRVLTQDGRAVIATWRSDDEVPLFRELRDIAEKHLGPIIDQRHSFGDSAALKSLLTDAGFRDVSVEKKMLTHRFEGGDVLIRLNTMALTGMSDAAKAMSDEERARVVDAIIADSAGMRARFAEDNGIAFEMSTNLAVARA